MRLVEPFGDDKRDIEVNGHIERPWWRTTSGVVLCGFLLVAGFFLLTQHTAHVFGVLPFLLILACPLLHIFHHGGHGGHGGHTSASPDAPSTAGTTNQSPGDRP